MPKLRKPTLKKVATRKTSLRKKPARKPKQEKSPEAADAASAGERALLVQRLWRAAQAQVNELERRLAGTLAPEEREREARTMAVLVKTLREIGEFDGRCEERAATQADDAGAAADANDDDPREIDEFRRELARRIEAIRAAADPEAACEP